MFACKWPYQPPWEAVCPPKEVKFSVLFALLICSVKCVFVGTKRAFFLKPKWGKFYESYRNDLLFCQYPKETISLSHPGQVAQVQPTWWGMKWINARCAVHLEVPSTSVTQRMGLTIKNEQTQSGCILSTQQILWAHWVPSSVVEWLLCHNSNHCFDEKGPSHNSRQKTTIKEKEGGRFYYSHFTGEGN